MIEAAARCPTSQWRLLLIVILSWPFPGLAYVSDDAWKLVSGKGKDLQVYTKVVEGQAIKAVKAVTTLNAPITTLLMVLSDDELVPEWIPVIGKAELLQDTDADGVSVMYLITKFPWPVKDRETVVETLTTYDESTNTVIMESTGVPGYVQGKKGVIRTRDSYTRWKIHPLEDGKLHVEIITHTDPRGFFPKWLMNMIVTRTPRTMFTRLEELLDKEIERNRPFDEIHVFGKEVRLSAPLKADTRQAEAKPRGDQPLEPPETTSHLGLKQLPMMDLDTLGRTSSRLPLAELEVGFVDPAIMGTWGWFEDCAFIPNMEPDAQGLCYVFGFRARFGETAALELVDQHKVMTGYTSLLSGRRYLNLTLIDCADCSDEQRAEFTTGACPYTILQYSTEESPRMAPDKVTTNAEEIALFDGRYLSVANMDRDFLRDAIKRGLIDGNPACEACVWTDGPCITSERQAMQDFVRKYDAQLYPADNWRAYARIPASILQQAPELRPDRAPRPDNAASVSGFR